MSWLSSPLTTYTNTCRKLAYGVVQKAYMEFNFTVSGRIVKLKSVKCMEVYYAIGITLSITWAL